MRSALISVVLTVLISAGISSAQAPRPRVPVANQANPAIPPNRPAEGTAVSPAAPGNLAPVPQAPNVPRSVGGTTNTGVASVGGEDQPSEAAANAGLANQAEPVAQAAGAKTWCDLYISQTSPKDIAAFDNTGVYLSEVREINIWIAVATKVPQARLTSWAGVYRPLDPAKLQAVDWRVRKIVTVPAEEFQRMVAEGTRPAAAAK